MEGTEHYIGQILYVISSKNLEIIPIVISEQVYVKTLSGSNVSWTAIIGPPGEKRKTIDITKIKEKKFSSTEGAKKHLMENFENLIDATLKVTTENKSKWYKQDLPNMADSPGDTDSFESIGDFSRESTIPLESSNRPVQSEEEARQRIREALQANDDEEMHQGQME